MIPDTLGVLMSAVKNADTTVLPVAPVGGEFVMVF